MQLVPVLPLRKLVAYPYVIVQFVEDRTICLAALETALERQRELLLLTQRNPEVEDPKSQDLFGVGTLAILLRVLRSPSGQVRVLAQGLSRARVERMRKTERHLEARVRLLDLPQEVSLDLDLEARVRAAKQGFFELLELGKDVAPEVRQLVATLKEPGRIADLLASNLDLSTDVAQQLLEELDPKVRMGTIEKLLKREREILKLEHQVAQRAQEDLEKAQRELYLRYQLRAIQEELAEGRELAEAKERIREKAEQCGLPQVVREELERQLNRLERLPPDSVEASVQRTYLEWLVAVPWNQRSEDQLDLDRARKILDQEHWGLDEVKERVLEFLAVRKLRQSNSGSILCLVGLPGVGKSSLARSIATALNRKFVRCSLGGVQDEAEIRGHRRTYVGALPGRIVQGLAQAGTANPVFLLDEIDKLGRESRGDLQAALLEVLDPELNRSFRDHYLGVPFDLSEVFWIATANWLEPLHPALRDRLEVLEIPAYTLSEKLNIARRHLWPRQLTQSGFEAAEIRMTSNALKKLIQEYTCEAGLRQLNRQLERISRKLAMAKVAGQTLPRQLGEEELHKILGPPPTLGDQAPRTDQVGVAVGLAWTPTGGELLLVEALAHPGKGHLLLTGQLGEVLRESAQAALSFVRSWMSHHGFEDRYFQEHDFHLHFPSGAIPKDGPSAGLAVAAALVSLRSQKELPCRQAWTGEVTLRGEVLAVGGLRDKLLAAQRYGLRRVVLPAANEPEVRRLPAEVTRGLNLHFVARLEEALEPVLRASGAGSGRTLRRTGAVLRTSRTHSRRHTI